MLWISLAVGAVLGLVVYLTIRFLRWSSDSLSRRGTRMALPSTQGGVTPDKSVLHGTHRAAALRVVDDIRLEMGALRTDVVWTISNSALWDMAVPESRSFFTALTVWEDHHAGWRTHEVVDAAAELKVLWKAATDTATRLGINHLSAGDRPRADTAIKLVRKAASTNSDAERHQLMVKAAEVLSGIISIAIPRETMREIEQGGLPPALPGAQDDPPSAPPT